MECVVRVGVHMPRRTAVVHCDARSVVHCAVSFLLGVVCSAIKPNVWHHASAIGPTHDPQHTCGNRPTRAAQLKVWQHICAIRATPDSTLVTTDPHAQPNQRMTTQGSLGAYLHASLPSLSLPSPLSSDINGGVKVWGLSSHRSMSECLPLPFHSLSAVTSTAV